MPEEQQQQPAPEAQPDQQEPDGQEVDELAGLDDRARRLVERANTEAATRRRRERELEEQLQGLQRKYESEQERRDREISERERAAGRAERDEEVAGLKSQLLDQRIKIRAAGRFQDPEDAPLYVDRGALGAVDPRRLDAAIDKALGDVLDHKPHLAAGQQQRQPLITQGGRSSEPNGRARERSWLRG